ncbi:protein MIZU-KUSSEI 1-like [Cucurbita maxima]|uniref:Protein MIZU-KUSSEI 1-like n=1 Tax=Cucurbita maxima TaxID=3661 RepID=A0A6J1IGY2_CUCMA|nr:protein MIZU-KUSSEI 1-like [Cucurbita maxima]
MKTMMAKSSNDSSFSFSRRYFHFKNKDSNQGGNEDDHQVLTFNHFTPKHKHGIVSISKLRSAIAALGKARSDRVVGTIFGHRRGHVHFSVQPKKGDSKPTFLVELAMPTTALVREMASGAARIALECERWSKGEMRKKAVLQEEAIWRAYCNGKKYGVAQRFECGAEEWRILRAVGPITVGAGVLPANGDVEEEEDGEVMFMRASFERVVGSRDSEAFYMINPEGVGGPELSIFLLRV